MMYGGIEYSVGWGGPSLSGQVPEVQALGSYLRRHYSHPLIAEGELQRLPDDEQRYFCTWRLHNSKVWHQLAIVAFPYLDSPWSPLVAECFDQEGRTWRAWCDHAAEYNRNTARTNGGRDPIPALWMGLDKLTSKDSERPPAGGHLIGRHEIAGFPVLVRPYLPWPTLRQRPMAPGSGARIRRTLWQPNPAANWRVVDDASIISDGEQALPLWWSLAEPNLPSPMRSLLSGRLERPEL